MLDCRHPHAPYSPTIDARVCLACRRVLPAAQNKYHARRADCDGYTFASAAELRHYLVLRDRERRGDIADLVLQPRFRLRVNGVAICTYVADFQYVENGATVVCDVKGVRTPVYRLKRALMRAVLGIDVQEVTS